MQTLDSPAARAAFRQVTHIYTDLDGTMFAPGGRMLTNHKGEPSLQLAEALVRLRQRGIEVIITTGRDVSSCTEIMRLANFDQFIGEMGCVTQYGYGENAQKHYNLGEWPPEFTGQDDSNSNGDASMTPFERISQSEALAAFLDHFKGRIEELTFRHNREVTHLLWGNVDTSPGGEVEQFFAQHEPPLQMYDNGIVHPKKHGLTDVSEVHIYNLVPRGSGKGEAVAADMAKKGLAPEQVLAIGDSKGDLPMGKHTGSFVLVTTPDDASLYGLAEAAVAHPENLFATTLPTADGWVEFANALLKAQE